MTTVRNCLIPRNLVMTPCICFYCGAAETGMVLCGRLFGIKCCDEHFERGERDCKAWMHKNSIVRLYDSQTVPELEAFLEYYKNGFPVMRSSGVGQPGWNFNSGDGLEPALLQKIGDKWVARCFYFYAGSDTQPPEHITKGVYLEAFDNKEIVDGLIRVLDEGVYKKEFLEHLQYFTGEEDNYFVDGPNIMEVLVGDKVRRVWVGV